MELYGRRQKHLSPGSFQKGSENRERAEKYWNQQHSRIFNIKKNWKRLYKDRACISGFFLFTFYSRERTFTRWLVLVLSLSSDILSDSLCSGVLCENHFDIFVIYLSEQLCKSDSDSCIKSVKFRHNTSRFP